MVQLKASGFKVLAACTSADSVGGDFHAEIRALEFYLKKIDEHPEFYRIVRTTRDIDEAIAENKPGLFFTHQGVKHFEGDSMSRPHQWKVSSI